MIKFKIICMRCDKFIKGDKDTTSGNTSHGICKECKEFYDIEIEKMKKERKNV